MFTIARRGWHSPASIVAVLSFAVVTAAGAVVCQAIEPRYAAIGVSDTDVPLALRSSFGPAVCGQDQYDVVWSGKGMEGSGGTRRLRLNIPGTPVAAYLYLVGTDDFSHPAPHFPNGDDTVRVAIRPEGGTLSVANAPVAYAALDAFVNKLDITPFVAPGINYIRVSGYDLNDPEGVVAVAVYTAPGKPAVQIDLFDGADFGYYPLAPPFGPDSEVVASLFPPEGVDRQGRVWMALGGLEPGRGDEIFSYTGGGDPGTDIADTDGDLLPDILQRQYRLLRTDVLPLRNDWAVRRRHREAIDGAVSLEEDLLGVHRRDGGYGRGRQLDMFTRAFPIPIGHDYAAFQVQSEDPEFGDSLVLFLAATRIPYPGCNPFPDFIVTKSASIDEGFPGDLVTYTFVVTNTGSERLENIEVNDNVLGYIGTVTLGIGESATLTYTDYVLPVCGSSAFTVETLCDGTTYSEERCSLPNTVTATWGQLSRWDKDCVEIKKRGRIIVVKETLPDGAAGSFDFATSYGPGAFSLSDGQSNDSGALLPGTYSVSETVPAGWTLTSAVCSDGSPVAAIDLQPGETVTCTFTNTREEEPGRIIVKKVTDPSGAPQTFDFSGDVAGTIGDGGTLGADVVPGTYTSTEGAVAGWVLTDITCDDGDSTGAGSTATFRVAAGETVTCTFTNTKEEEPGTIIVVKNTVGGDGSFTFTSGTLSPSPFTLTTSLGTASREFGDLPAGIYDVAETPAPGWTPAGTVCTSSLGGTEDPAAIDLAAGETVTCTFTNTKCQECLGKVSMLRLQFLGSVASQVRVTARGDRFPNDVVFDGIVGPGGVLELHGGYSPEGGFDGTLGTEVDVYVNGVLDTRIHTSCSQPIGPGQVWGSFVILYGESKLGGSLCPLPPQGE